MAELQVEGGELVLRRPGTEQAEAVHGDLREPLIVGCAGPEAVAAGLSWPGRA
jgi:hypothetical protein